MAVSDDVKNKGGRPSLLTPELQEQILELTREGNFVTTVTNFCEIARDTIYGWLEKGESGDTSEANAVYVAFARAYRKAEAEAEIASGKIARQPGEKGKGERWFMERRWPDRYGKRLRAEITGADGGSVKVEVDPAQLLEKINALAAEASPNARPERSSVRDREALSNGEGCDPEGS